MNDFQKKRAKEFSDFYGWPLEQVEELFGCSKAFFECVWLGMNPITREEEEAYYNGPWLTLRQMSYDENDALPNSLRKFIEEMKPNQKLISIGCGVGDDILYAQNRGIEAIAQEVTSKCEFLKFRGIKITTRDIPDEKFDRAIMSSVLDHVPDPEGLAELMCRLTNGPIYATPCIDETYDRPTHNKAILKHVPEAFRIIKEHNAPFIGTATFP